VSLWSAVADRALPLRLTLLVLVLRPPGDGSLKAATWLVAGAALMFPALTLSARAWLALTILVGARIVFDWPLADNHIYLLAYWCLAVTLALWHDLSASSNDPEGSYHAAFDILRRSSRWLLGFAFLCAVVWKAFLSPDYLDGRFFRVTLSTDDRFAPIARAAGLTDDQIAANREALEPLPAGAEALNGPVLTEPPMLRRVAAVLTWGRPGAGAPRRGELSGAAGTTGPREPARVLRTDLRTSRLSPDSAGLWPCSGSRRAPKSSLASARRTSPPSHSCCCIRRLGRSGAPWMPWRPSICVYLRESAA
jgi:hypothetical protein